MALTLATELADYASGIGTQGATLKIDADNKRVGVGTTNPQGPEGTLQVGTGITFFGNTGIISAIGGKFSGDFTVGGTLTYEDVQNVNSSGVGTFSGGINVVGGGLTVTGVSTFFSALDVNSTADFAGAISVGDTISLGDHDKLRFGAGNDLQIYHDGTDSYVQDSRDNGRLRLSADILQVIDKDATETMLKATVDGAVELNYNGSKKFETGPAGTITVGVGTFDGLSLGDSEIAKFGNSDDLQIFHDGSDSYVRDAGTGNLQLETNGNLVSIYNRANTENMAKFIVNGAVELYHNGTKKFETTTDGTITTGINTSGGFRATGNNTPLSGQGLEMFCPDTSSSQIQSFDRTNGETDKLIIRGNPIEFKDSSNTVRLEVNPAGVNITGIATATSLFEGTTRVATTGKAIAMAMLFG